MLHSERKLTKDLNVLSIRNEKSRLLEVGDQQAAFRLLEWLESFTLERVELDYFCLLWFCHQIVSRFANTPAPKLNKKDPIVLSILSPPILLGVGRDRNIIA